MHIVSVGGLQTEPMKSLDRVLCCKANAISGRVGVLKWGYVRTALFDALHSGT
jgi:hypothetical protein